MIEKNTNNHWTKINDCKIIKEVMPSTAAAEINRSFIYEYTTPTSPTSNL